MPLPQHRQQQQPQQQQQQQKMEQAKMKRWNRFWMGGDKDKPSEPVVVASLSTNKPEKEETCTAPAPATTGFDLQQPLNLINVVASWCAVLMVLCVWQWKKRRSLRRRRSRQQPSLYETQSSTTVQLREHESLVDALQQELQERSVAENEQAILWRQEKRILQNRIDELLVQKGTVVTSEEEEKKESKERHEIQLLQQVKELQETVAFLTNLTESQTQEIDAKQHEIDKLTNILDELQHHVAPTAAATPLTTGISETPKFHMGDTTTDDDDDSDDDLSCTDDDSEASHHHAQQPLSSCTRLKDGNKVVLLVSTMPGNLSTSVHQSRLESIFRQGLRLSPRFLEIVDGCDASLHSLRNDLFQISGMHAVYPQVFLVHNSDIQFVGDFDTVQDLHDARELPQKIGLLLPEDEDETETMTSSDDVHHHMMHIGRDEKVVLAEEGSPTCVKDVVQATCEEIM